MQNNITFIGQTFAGKTTGKNVAKQIGYKFKDLDEEVQKKMEMSIAEMLKILNDPYDFRIETLDDMKNIFIEVYEDLLKEEKTIISIGAYFVEYYEEFDKVDNLFFLNISLELYLERLKEAMKVPNNPENVNRRIVKKAINEGLDAGREQYNSRQSMYEHKIDNQDNIFELDVFPSISLKNYEKEIIKRIKEINKKRCAKKRNRK